MENKKYQSNKLIDLLYSLSSVIMIAWLFYITSLSIIFIMSIFQGFSGTIAVEWPVLFSDQLQDIINLGNHPTFIRPHDSDYAGLNQLSAELALRSYMWPYFNAYTFISTILKYTLMVAVVYLLRKIIIDIKQQIPFSLNNVRRLKHMALLLFALFPYAMIDSIINHWYIINYVEMVDVEFISRIFTRSVGAQSGLVENQILLLNKQSISSVIYALIVYIVAVIFAEGLKIKEDNESIV